MGTIRLKRYEKLPILLLFCVFCTAALAVAALFTGPPGTLPGRLLAIVQSPQSLTVDACAVGGLNAALLNAALCGLVSCALFYFTGAPMDGLGLGAYALPVGMSLFGENFVTILPLIAGVWLYCRYKKIPFARHVCSAMFTGALAPFMAEMLFPRGYVLPLGLSIPLMLAAGVALGFVFIPIAELTYTMHKGNSLFNAGLAAGLMAILLYFAYHTLVLEPLGVTERYGLLTILSEGHPVFFPVALALLFCLAALTGFIYNGFKFDSYWEMMHHSGHDVDFTVAIGEPEVLLNFGLVGLTMLVYMIVIDAPWTGPTAGAIICAACWAGKGAHPINVLPILAGYLLVSFAADWTINAQAIVVGACFATGLAPVSGRWGSAGGVVAGAMHACIVLYTPQFHGGFNCYNGGFTCGIVAVLLVPILENFFPDAEERHKQRAFARFHKEHPQPPAEPAADTAASMDEETAKHP